jgi:SAM-dependent methyltransferase
MHDTAYQIGRAFFDTYVGDRDVRVLEIGSLDVNGSLRDFARPNWRYVGADHVAGKGVDVVLNPNERLPFDDGAFDVVVATSVLEHDPFFWETFEDLARVLAPEGLIYINSPSNGDVHRFPRDYWRFYPESGLSMAAWIQRKGVPMVVVESFIATRGAFSFNDYVAVFAKSEAPQHLPATPLYEQFVCLNALRYGNEELIFPSSATEDMIYLDQARRRAASAEARVAELEAQLARSRLVLGAVELANREIPPLRNQFDSIGEQVAAGWTFSPSDSKKSAQVKVDAKKANVKEAGVAETPAPVQVDVNDTLAQARRVLDSVELASREIPPLWGYLDAISERVAAGWAFSPSNPETPVMIQIHVNGAPARAVPADHHRADLLAAGHGAGNNAFNIDLSDLGIAPNDEIVVTMMQDISAIELGRHTVQMEAVAAPEGETQSEAKTDEALASSEALEV